MQDGERGCVQREERMRFAIVGCGCVADDYLATLVNHSRLELTGVFDRDPERARVFSTPHRTRRYQCHSRFRPPAPMPWAE